ncbi:SpaH/EbpB family LPXTG-anchored major pilin [Agrococcus sp. Marseille-Q4369]|uniref:SpaH/EbpB family LPXTG-anchored major pilin n=1 Tax=Agrococcus sp. Marseille-Q4369 TaxID=2810513 RepID=UPI001B8B8257|nr:SpaH/EbpB family LPXTG-anchored major pilin [Agrococcus sp. Marseille-Q4369]QUW18290.1 SpaH/EbpB family LPXTG-anchored major pilin [Agrococcus sp. Marseille-Q4369]
MRTRTFAARRSFRAVATAIVLATAVVLPLTPLAPSAAEASATSTAPQPVPPPEPTAAPEPPVASVATEPTPAARPTPEPAPTPTLTPTPAPTAGRVAPAPASSAAPELGGASPMTATSDEVAARTSLTTTAADPQAGTMAVGAAETSAEVPFLHWRVSPAVAGSSFQVEYQARSGTSIFGFVWWGRWSSWSSIVISDCERACGTHDLDPDRGEFQVTHIGTHRVANDTAASQFRYRVTPATAPAGYEWSNADARPSAQGANPGGAANLGVFELGLNPPATCTAGTFYALTTTGSVQEVTSRGTISEFGRFVGVPDGAQMNSLGIGSGGSVVYALERQSGSASGAEAIHRYSVQDGWQRLPNTSVVDEVSFIAGAVNLADGRYYFGGYRGTGASTSFELWVFDPTTGRSSVRGSFNTALTSTTGRNSNGDIAFDVLGNLFVVQDVFTSQGARHGSRIYTVPAASVRAGGALATTVTSPNFSGLSTAVNGAAFDGNGTIILGNSNTARVYDPAVGALRTGSVTTSLPTSGDLASCLSPATLTVEKHVVGRVASGDQFTLSVSRGATLVASARTSGVANGLQEEQVGPVTVLTGQTYSIAETATSNADRYASTYSCRDENDLEVASGDGTSGTVAIPPRGGASIVCTFRNAPLTGSVVVRKIIETTSGVRSPVRDWQVSAGVQASSGVVDVDSTVTQRTSAQGEARWNLSFGSSAARASVSIAEVQQDGYAFREGACLVTPISGEPTTVTLRNSPEDVVRGIAPGTSVECEFVNRELPTTLTLVNTIDFGSASTSQWTLIGANPHDPLPGPSGATGVTASVSPGVAYELDARGPATYAQIGTWVCRDQDGDAVSVAASGVALEKGTQATCTVTHSTAHMTLLKHIDASNGGALKPEMFTLQAAPDSFDGLSITSVRGSETEIANGVNANRFDVRPGHGYTLTETSDLAALGLRLERRTGLNTWVTVTNPAVQVPAGQHYVYRFVNAPVPALALPLTGGIGSDSYVLGGGALVLLALAFPLFRSRRSAQREPGLVASPTTKTPSINLLFARIQKGTAAMATIKKSRAARIAAGLGAAAIATVTILGGALPASAAANIDPAPPVSPSITIHKHEQPATPGQAGTGSPTDPVAGEPIAGVQFSIQRVTNLDVLDNTTWDLLRADRAGGALDANEVLFENPSAYTVAPLADASNAWTVTTATDGVVEQNLPLGIYLVRELNAPASAGVVIPAQPFLVAVPQPAADGTWNYNVHVFPKNTVTDVVKHADVFAQEGLGSDVTWTLDIGVPAAVEGTRLNSFVIKDKLDPRLTYNVADASAVSVRVGTDVLTRVDDYEVTLADNTVLITFSESGLQALRDNRGARVAVTLVTEVSSFTAANGTIANTASVIVNGAEVLSNVANDYWGGIELQKHDDNGQPLADAVFEVRDANGDAVAIGDRTEFRSNSDGIVEIHGLRTNAAGNAQYTVVEIAAPAGYRLGTQTSWNIEVPLGAPSGVELTVVNEQVPAYALPITGGSGQAAFMIGGAGLILGGLGFVLLRRRKAQAENQA